MALAPSVPPTHLEAPLPQYTLNEFNEKQNMTDNSIVKALFLLSTMYLNALQSEPGPAKVGLHAIFPKTIISLQSSVTNPFRGVNKRRTFMDYPAAGQAFDISSSFTKSDFPPQDVLKMLCDDVFPKNTITIFYLNNPIVLQQYRKPAVKYLPQIIESLGLPIISYDTQFSINSRPKLSVQLAPTMGQMMDVMFAFLKRFSWTDFSFLCTLSYGCQDEIASIRLKVDDSHRRPNVSVYGVQHFSYNLLSYVNFTNGRNVTEIKEKLKYDLDKDTRILLVHGSGAEVKTILDTAKELGLTGKEYVWIFTSASISLTRENAIVDDSYPLGSFVIGFDNTRDDMADVVKDGVNLWLKALNSLATSEEFEKIDFDTHFTCDGLREDNSHAVNNSVKSPLFWKYGEIIYQQLLKTKLPNGLEFDEFGVLKSNKFWIMNVQLQGQDVGSSSSTGRGGGSPFGGRNRNNDRSRGGFLRGRSPGGSWSSQSRTSSAGRGSGSPFSRDRNTESPISRGRDSGSSVSRGRDSGSPFSRDRDTGSPISRGRDSGSPFSRDRDTGSPISRGRGSGSPFSRDRDTGSPFSRGRDSGSPFSRGRDSGSPFSRGRDSGRSQGRGTGTSSSTDRDSESPFSRDRSRNSDRNDGNGKSRPELSRDENSASPVDSLPTGGYEPVANMSLPSDADPSKTGKRSVDARYSGSQDGPDSDRAEWHSPTEAPGRFGHDRIRHRDGVKLTGKRGDHKREGADDAREDNETLPPEEQGSKKRSKRARGRRQIAKKVASWNGHNLTLSSITWPGGSSKPPKGKPEKYILRVVTWKEDPHVIYTEMKNETEAGDEICDAHSLPCKVYNRDKNLRRIGNSTKDMCCTGLCIDLLKRLSEILHFDVELSEVAEGMYGSPLNKNLTDWNGMLGMLIQDEADMAMGALSITPERSMAVDFSMPFLQTGITIIVAIRDGAISPTAFLEPYDYPSWSLILVFSVHATGASIFIFEWLSPYGLDQGKTPLSVHKFSLFRSFWLIWAMLFGASVSTDQPRGCASRFLANIWALFAVVFCASYTANLAAFMITKDDFYDLSGIQDWRLKNPHHRQPPFKFATIANSSTDLNIQKNYKEIHSYMNMYAQKDVKQAIQSLKAQEIQAFIYDSTTLEYEVGKDPKCKLKTVGKRIAETGYGVAFPRKSQWVKIVDKTLLRLQEDGEIERLQKFWLAGACHKKKETGVSSHTLGILNFTSAFILLGGGVILGVVLLLMEHVYFRFGRKSLKKWDRCGCCSLVSLSMGQSLTFEQSVMEAIDLHRHHKCKDPLCETQLWKVRHELDIALLKISQLRKQIAHSASLEAARENEDDTSSKYDHEEPYSNGSARRRRQQPSDSGGSSKNEKSANQPLLALEGRNDTDSDDTPVQSPKRTVPSSSRASFPSARNKQALRDSDIPLQNVRHSYPEPQSPTRRSSDGRPSNRVDPSQRDYAPSMKATVDLDFHPPPPTFDEALLGFGPTPEDSTTSSPSPPLPPPPPPAMAASSPHSPIADAQRLSNSFASNSLPSSDDKRYEPFVLDSPESPASSSFSEVSGNQLPSPGALSKLSDEGPSTPASPDRDSYLTSSPDNTKSIDDSNGVPTVKYAPASPIYNAQSKHPMSSKDSQRPGSMTEEGRPQKHQASPQKASREDDNDVNVRRTQDKDGNVYVNVDDILGKETAF